MYIDNDEKPSQTNNDMTSNQQLEKSNGQSVVIDIPHDMSHPEFHTGNYIPLAASDLALEIRENSEGKLIRREKSVDKNLASGLLLTPKFMKQSSVMALWFFFSFASIVLNKYILSTLDVDPSVLGECQILMTTFLCSIMMNFQFLKNSIKHEKADQTFNRYQFYKMMSFLGLLRCASIICSVIGLKYVAVSFSETIKSSAPLFTAIMAYLILGEYSGLYVNLSLMPIMFGLAISTYTEINFNLTGFVAACTNNILDCIQNVFSKKLLCSEDTKYSPLELQFYTNVAASVVQIPFWFLFDVYGKLQKMDYYVAAILIFDGFIFYLQSLFAYSLMSLISPVTFSVSNTVKRAGLIWFSILVFGNKVTLWNGFGTLCVVGGVFLYQRARIVETSKREARLR